MVTRTPNAKRAERQQCRMTPAYSDTSNAGSGTDWYRAAHVAPCATLRVLISSWARQTIALTTGITDDWRNERVPLISQATKNRNVRMDSLREYCLRGHRTVPGWLQRGTLSVLWSILEFHERADIRADVAEIGVYQGRLFVMFALSLRAGERAHAIDPFSMPATGPFRAKFEANLVAAAIDPNHVDIHEMLSEAIEIGSAARYFGAAPRLISIDGAHTRKNVMYDLSLADECLSQQGIVAVDDFFNPWCADLSEGVFEFLRHSQNLVPVALADSSGPRVTGALKLFPARPDSAEQYREALTELNGRNLKTSVKLCGSQTLVFDFAEGVRKKIVYKNPRSMTLTHEQCAHCRVTRSNEKGRPEGRPFFS
jgi:hypothetical protein